MDANFLYPHLLSYVLVIVPFGPQFQVFFILVCHLDVIISGLDKQSYKVGQFTIDKLAVSVIKMVWSPGSIAVVD